MFFTFIDIVESFNLIDLNGDGKISVFEMMSIMNSAGEDVSAEDVEDIFEIVDLDGMFNIFSHTQLWFLEEHFCTK